MSLHAKASSGELLHLERRLKRTVRLCKAIYQNNEYISLVKEAIESDDLTYASQLFHELELEDQKLLMTAPLYGGPFTTIERGIMRGLWDVRAEDF